jgi:phage repressor protein C with HTH and peptisase S24 domain
LAEWNHQSVWSAIDALAERHRLSPSALAKKAGLDATAFNPSKRHGPDPEKRPRWPSTESISKILVATGETLENFVALARGKESNRSRAIKSAATGSYPTIPLLGFAQAGGGGFFDDGGFPQGQGWDEIQFPGLTDETAYALKVTGESMLPFYREGDVIIVSPTARVRRGDRVVVKTTGGEVMAKVLKRQSTAEMELASFNPSHPARVIPAREVEWVARILWASQ